MTAPRRNRWYKQFIDAQKRGSRLVLTEMLQVRGLFPLLMKHRNGETWTPDERKELRQQLRSLWHVTPFTIIMILPGSFILLPLIAWWLDRRRGQRAIPSAH